MSDKMLHISTYLCLQNIQQLIHNKFIMFKTDIFSLIAVNDNVWNIQTIQTTAQFN